MTYNFNWLKILLMVSKFFIIKIVGNDENNNYYELKFEGCQESSWWCVKSTNSYPPRFQLRFNCTPDFEKNNSYVKWVFKDLPNPKLLSSVTIENCDIHLNVIGYNPYFDETIRPTEEDIASNSYLPNLQNITFRNITQLSFTNFSKISTSIKDTVVIENIKVIENLPSYFINGSYHSIKVWNNELSDYHTKVMWLPRYAGPLTFTMRNVNIGYIDKEAVYWNDQYHLINLNWENVIVNETQHEFIKIIHFNENHCYTKGWSYYHRLNGVLIKNCKFSTLMNGAGITVEAQHFQFINNEVNSIEKESIQVRAQHTKITGNIFHSVHELAFKNIVKGSHGFIFEFNTINSADSFSMYFDGFPVKVEQNGATSFRGNKFNCSNSEWLLSPSEENNSSDLLNIKDFCGNKSRDIKKSIENFENQYFFSNFSDNVCIDSPKNISIKEYHQSHSNNPNNAYSIERN